MKTTQKLNIPLTEIKLGDRAKDVVSNFEGIVTGHARHLTGCDTVCLRSENPETKNDEAHRWFDVMRLELVEENPLGISGMPNEVPPAG